MPNRCKLNILIDYVLLLLLAAMAGLGLLIKYVLISGSRQWALYGENVDLRWCGLDRHQWGTIHLLVAAAFILFLLLHLIFHWKPICTMTRQLLPTKGPRLFAVALVMLLTLALLIFPAFLDVKPIAILQGQGHHSKTRPALILQARSTERPVVQSAPEQPPTAPQPTEEIKDEEAHHHRGTPNITGQMTLREVEDRYHVPVDALKNGLGLPAGTPAGQQLGRLKKRYGFHMSDVERIIIKHSESHSQ